MPPSNPRIACWPDVGDRIGRLRDAAGPAELASVRSEADAIVAARDADAFIGRMTPAILAGCRRLRWVQCPTASLEHYVFPELIAHPSTLTNAAGLFGDVVAEHTLGLLLSFTRNLHLYRDRQRSGEARKVGGGDGPPDFAAGPAVATEVDRRHVRLADWTIAVVGMGDIGRAVAKAVSRFGAAVVGVDPVPRDGFDVRPPGRVDEAVAGADAVVLACPHTPATEGWFDAARFAAMKAGAVLVNVGRGAVVRTDELCDAIDAGHLRGAALDVLEDEPPPPGHRLWTTPEVILTPHVAAASEVVAERHLELLCDNLARFAAGRPPRNVVDKSAWA